MRLRSRNILNENPTTPCRRRRRAAPETPGPQTPLLQTQDEVKVLQDRLNLDPDDVPTVAKRPRRRRKALTVDNKESDFKTPVRHLRERHSSLNPAARSLYSPAVHFLTPPRDREQPNTSPMFSPEHCVFGYSAANPLSEDEENEEVFSPFTFIKNIPNRSQQSRPVSAVRDIPPKTRSTPAATLVLDLDETLVFSSLNVIHDAEYTFNTRFQDHKYKVIHDVDEFVSSSDLEKCSIASLAHQWILCSEWVPLQTANITDNPHHSSPLINVL